MLKFANIWLLGVHFGSHKGTLRGGTPPNIIFEMSFDNTNPGKVAFLIEFVTETSGTYISKTLLTQFEILN